MLQDTAIFFRYPRPQKQPTISIYFISVPLSYFSVQWLVLQCSKLSFEYLCNIVGF